MEESTQAVIEAQTMTPASVGEQAGPPPPAIAFTKVDNNLTGIGFFTASSKRSRRAIEKTTVVMDQGIEHTISILPSAKYGLPITQDQDYWLALMKLVAEHVQREGKLTNPFSFSTAQLLKILGQVDSGNNYKSVEEWLSVMKSTTVEGGAYNVVRKTWFVEKTGAIDRVITVGKQLQEGGIADKNHVWFSQWQLDNINAGNLIPIELATYNQLANNISKNLVPHLQEWLYASQRDGRFEKQYEDVCQLLGIRVYRYRSQISEQLSPSLDELVIHRYISKWAIEPMANRKTYKLVLLHGSKYHGDQQIRSDRKHRTKTISSPVGESAQREHRPRQKFLPLTPEVNNELLSALTSRGVSEPAGRKILAALPADYPTMETLEWGDHQIASQQSKFTNPPGFYISLLRDRLTPPTTFESSQARKARQTSEFERQEGLRIEAEAEEAARAAAEAELDRFKANHPEQYQAIYNQAQTQLFADHPKMADFAKAHLGSSMHEGAIRSRMRQLMAQGVNPTEATFVPQAEALFELAKIEVPLQANAAPQDERVEEAMLGETLFAAMLKMVLTTAYLPAPSKPDPAPKSPESSHP